MKNRFWTLLLLPSILFAPGTASAANAPFNWSSWYAGGTAGIADTSTSISTGNQNTTDLQSYGATVGLVGGYNWVQSNGLFYGGEADVNYVNNKESSNAAGTTMETAWHEYATVRGRVGIALDPALVFLTGGLAVTNVSNRYYAPGTTWFSGGSVVAGWAAGGGAEFALTDNISLSAQYLTLEMPQHPYTTPYSGPTKFLVENPASIFRTGLNWHFN
jgi:outer membrane immunogenic protein